MKSILFLLVLVVSPNVNSATITLMGGSWLAGTFNPSATREISRSTSLPVGNYAMNSLTASELLWQVQTLYKNGVRLGAHAAVIIDIGLSDFLGTPSTSRDDVQKTLFKIVDIFAKHSVKVFLSGAPEANTPMEINAGNLHIDPLFENVRKSKPKWVTILDLQSPLMMIPQFAYKPGDHVHLNANGYRIFNLVLANKVRQFNKQLPICNDDITNQWFIDIGLNQHDEYAVRELLEQYNDICLQH
jgi:hypothetical protein